MEWLERGKEDNSHSGGESSSSIWCWNCSTCRAWLSIFCIDFFAIIFSTSFWMLQICLIGNWKRYRAKLLPAQTIAVFLREILVSVHRGWKIPRGHFRSINYLCTHVHFGVYLKARCRTTSRTRVCSWLCSGAIPEAEGSSNISSGSTGCISVRVFPFVKSVAGVKIQIGEWWVRATR